MSTFDVTKFEFQGQYLLIQALREEKVNGLVKPEQYDDKSEFGLVIKAGMDAFMIQPGDVVFFGKYSSESVRVGGVDYLIIHSEDVKAVLHAPDTGTVQKGGTGKTPSK